MQKHAVWLIMWFNDAPCTLPNSPNLTPLPYVQLEAVRLRSMRVLMLKYKCSGLTCLHELRHARSSNCILVHLLYLPLTFSYQNFIVKLLGWVDVRAYLCHYICRRTSPTWESVIGVAGYLGAAGKVTIIIWFSSLMQISYFVGLLLITFNLLTCIHSQGMFHHSPIFVLHIQKLVTIKLGVLGIYPR